MTVDEFKAALKGLGWKQTDFCRKAGLNPTTVSRWVVGDSPIPRWVPQYLGMALDVRELYEKYALKPPRPQPGDEEEVPEE